MRYRLPLAIALLSLAAESAHATSVNLRWQAGSANTGSITGLGTSSVTIAPSAVATLTLDIRIAVDAAGLSSAFLSLEFDRDLLNELNLISFEELSWTGVMMTTMAAPKLEPFVPVLATQESTSARMGLMYTFNTTALPAYCCPFSTTIAFGRVVFQTNHVSNGDDGPDIFSGLFFVGVDGLFDQRGYDISLTTTFGTARVNQGSEAIQSSTPEPATLALLGLGLGALTAAARRRQR